MILGLVLQIVFVIFFLTTACIFEARMDRNPTAKVYNDPKLPWRRHLYTLYLGSAFILLRCVFRVAEYAQGEDYYGYLVGNEWCVYVFDACFMVLVMAWFAAVHPSEIAVLIRGRGNVVENVVCIRRVSVVEPDAVPLTRVTVVYGGTKGLDSEALTPAVHESAA